MIPEGTIVEYDNTIMKGQGKVVGVIDTGHAIIGRNYMIEDLSGNLPTEIHPYKTFACFECHMILK